MKVHTCETCGIYDKIDFKCVTCCVRWLKSMPDDKWRKANAPAIAAAVSDDHLNVVREIYKLQKENDAKTS